MYRECCVNLNQCKFIFIQHRDAAFEFVIKNVNVIKNVIAKLVGFANSEEKMIGDRIQIGGYNRLSWLHLQRNMHAYTERIH